MHGNNGVNKEAAARQAVIAGSLDTAVTLTAMVAANSAVLVADFLKTSLELVAVLLAWLALRHIARGNKHDFDYGLDKLENLSSLIIGLLMTLVVLIIFGNAVRNMLHPGHLAGIGVWISLVAQVVFGVINTRLYLSSNRAAKLEGSPVMKSQARLFFSRAFGNVFILLSLSASMLLADQPWSVYIDPAASMIIAVAIMMDAMRVFNVSVYDLLDRTLEEHDQIVILRELARHYDDYEGFHGVRSRRSGSHVYIEIFLEFRPDKTVAEAQAVIDALKRGIEEKLPTSQVSIGLARAPVTA